MRKLEDAGYVTVGKGYDGRKPQTKVHLTQEGRAAWITWIDRMKSIMNAAE
ncbi:MAG: transcriptional regulator [Pseudomonadota bacterium]